MLQMKCQALQIIIGGLCFPSRHLCKRFVAGSVFLGLVPWSYKATRATVGDFLIAKRPLPKIRIRVVEKPSISSVSKRSFQVLDYEKKTPFPGECCRCGGSLKKRLPTTLNDHFRVEPHVA